MTNIVIDTPEGLAFFQMAARKGALAMEIHGLRRRGRSAYSIVKSEYGLRGSRESVLAQLTEMVERAIAERQSPGEHIGSWGSGDDYQTTDR